jgi:hypothetical protein
MEKWPKRQRQDWQKKESRRRQRESTARAAEGADPAASARNQVSALSTFAPCEKTAVGVGVQRQQIWLASIVQASLPSVSNAYCALSRA